MKIKQLDGIWNLSPLQVSETLQHTRFFQRNPSILLTLPGDIHTALLESQIISDPYWATDEVRMQWVGETDWIAKKEFTILADDLTRRRAILSLTMVDTFVGVRINGKVVGNCSNQFRRWRFDCTDSLDEGTNTIEFIFTSPAKAARQEAGKLEYPVPYSTFPGSSPDRNLIRKTQCHNGWDCSPCLLAMGIYEPIILEFVELGYVESTTTAPSKTKKGWHVHIEIVFEAFAKGKLPIEAAIADGFAGKTVTVSPGTNRWELDLDVTEVEPWMPSGYGKPYLFPLSIKVGGRTIDKKIGFRTIEVITDDRQSGAGSLIFKVNGRKIFAKGANWVPIDAIPSRITHSRYNQLLQDAVEANMNMIRVWGGGMYEHDYFYQTCDELGLLVWQDCMFSCALYPATKEFLQQVEAELEYQVPRLHDHPSLALWCGNNEGYGAIGWYGQSRSNRDRHVIDYDRLNEGVVGKTIRRLDCTRMWWPSSPSAGPGKFLDNWHDDGSGDMHYWDVWHEGKPFESFYEVTPRFASEFGYQSLPSLESIASFAPEEQWNLTSRVMEHHQRHPRGNTIILENFARYFRIPQSFSAMVYLSQVQQALAMKMAIEYWRSQRPRCMGTLYWQLNDTWPVASWSSIESSGKWKLLHYAAKRFYAPLLPVLYRKGEEVQLHVINETAEDLDLRASVKFRKFDGTKVYEQVYQPHVSSDSSCHVTSISLARLPFSVDEGYLHVKLSNKEVMVENALFLTPPKYCTLHDGELSVAVETARDGFVLTIASKAPAFFVSLDAGSIPGTFTDNMFDVRPTAGKTIRFRSRKNTTREEFLRQLKIQDLYGSYQSPTN